MKVSFYATLRAIVGAKDVEIPVAEGTTVLELLHTIGARWPELGEQMLGPDGELTRQVHVLVDGRNTRWLPDGTATMLSAAATVDLFPPTAGG